MIGILSKILGSEKVIESGLKLIDDMHTSTEEEVAIKTQSKVQLLNAYAPFKLAQRVLAFGFCGAYILCFVLVMGMTLSGHGNPDSVTKVMEQFSIDYCAMIILGFYFGGGAVEGFLSAKKK
jgi:hypothetical protein